MKPIHLYLPILLIFAIFSCTSNDENMEEEQDYTSFVVTVDSKVPESIVFTNSVAAYMKNGEYHVIKLLGDISSSKPSAEIIIKDGSIDNIYIFSDYNNGIRFDVTFKVRQKYKNMFEIADGTKGILVSDKSDPTQYPH